MPHLTKMNWAVPIAILAASMLIAGGLYASRAPESKGAVVARAQIPQDFRLPNEADHIRGNPEATVAVIEFSDFECPFCARFHPTMQRIIDEGTDVKWIFRHFPLSTIHSRALNAAIASECVSKLGGNEAFWLFADAAFGNQHSLGTSLYEDVAKRAGIDLDEFNACVSDNIIAKEVQVDGDEAIQAGGRGTPFAVIVTHSGALAPFSGALPYEDVRRLVEAARTN